MIIEQVYENGINCLAEVAVEFAAMSPRSHAPVEADPFVTRIVPLFGDGSDRKFFRIFCGNTSFIALISPRKAADIDENDSYMKIGRHLHARGIPVPRILFADTAKGRFLLEDAGDLHLQRFALRRPQNLEKIYRRVLLMLASLHKKAPDGFSPNFCFDTLIYDARFIFERELEYFRKYFLNGYLQLETSTEKLRPDFERIAEAAGCRRMRFVFHRDFQSRNIMVSKSRLWLIDFQGMRFGPPAYDLASLMVDPYVNIPGGLQDRLAGIYWSAAEKFLDCSRGEFLKSYRAVRLCRNFQILGAFGFLGLVKEKRQFLGYIPGAFGQLRQWLFRNCRGNYPELERVIAAAGDILKI